MSLDEKHEMMKEIQNLNNNKMEKEEKIKQIIVKWGTSVEIETIRELDDIELMVRFWIEENTQIYHLSQKQIKEIVKRIKNLCVNWSIILDTEWEIVHNYGIISLVKKEDITYSYTIEKLEYKIFENVKLCAEGESTEAVTVCEEDFPICIRSPQKGDAIELRFGTKKLNRWFIDRKIPHSQRKSWPVVVNSKGKVILIPKIGCDVEHYSNNPNLFVIK